MSFIVVYVTHENEVKAGKIVDLLLKKRLIACANTFPIKSSYWWCDNLKSGGEVVSLLKTKPQLWGAVKKEVEANHPYDVPCIMKFEVEANKEYEQWVFSQTASE